ncbi:chemotaxis protein CheW [Desulfonatronovibrio hydrogenovorans]|uniref:chemotaxis protein CheW n=1 Tax=Desulfonatronovibrio hydrogenovorans TaxID=53245 RepID=UPI00048D798E|nr:chemotaxis protein CheW [Desulfonatronovibrio hydrogenovorans]
MAEKEKEIKKTNQYLTFTLAEELYAIDIAQVWEVLDYTPITRVPRTPEFLLGIINLRGRAVPVADLRLKFGLERTERTVNTCIIIAEVKMDGESTVMGALADSVQEVFEISPSEIEPPPKMGAKVRTEFIQGMAKHNDRFVIIIDVNKVFSSEEMSMVQEAGEVSE